MAPASLRRHNLSLVLGLLVDDGPRSRAALASVTGLTKASVSKLVVELVDRGLAREAEVVQGSTGRPATLVEVSPDRVVALALEVGVDELSVASVDLSGAVDVIVAEPRDNRAHDANRTLTRLARLAARAAHELEAGGRFVAGTTVAVPGLVANGRVLVAPNLDWREVDVRHRLDGRVPAGTSGVHVENEANLAALAEARARRSEPEAMRTFIHVSAGIGVGAGVIVGGELFRGAHGFGGELGHFVIDPHGTRCRCGNRGCLETIIGQKRLLTLSGRRRQRRGVTDEDAWIRHLSAAAAEGDEQVLAALREIGDALAIALAAAVSLFDPEAIVLGGFLTELAPWLAPHVEARLSAQVLGARWVAYPVVPSRLGRLAALAGAGAHTLQAVVADPLRVPPSA